MRAGSTSSSESERAFLFWEEEKVSKAKGKKAIYSQKITEKGTLLYHAENVTR